MFFFFLMVTTYVVKKVTSFSPMKRTISCHGGEHCVKRRGISENNFDLITELGEIRAGKCLRS